MHRIDGTGATTDSKFTEGNPTTGVPATEVTADIMNALQEELCAVIEAAGIPLSKANNAQLLAAIQSLIAGGGAAVTASGVTINDAGGYFTGEEVESALQQLAAKLYVGTINSNQIRRSVITINAASDVPLAAAHAENIVQLSSAVARTYTIPADATIDLPIGTAIEVVQAGAGKISFLPEAGATLLRPAVFNATTLGQHAVAVLYKVEPNTWRLGGMLEAA